MFELVSNGEGGEKKFNTLEEYRMATETLQKNKEGKLVILYSTDLVQQHAYIKAAEARNFIVVKLDTIIDPSFVNQIEMKWNDVHFTRVDSDITDNLIDKQENLESVLSKDEEAALKGLFDIKTPGLTTTVEVKIS